MQFDINGAKEMFFEGFNCSQCVLYKAAESGVIDIDKEKALKIAAPFGAGIARSGDTCGAVTGGLMAIGCKYGNREGRDISAKETTLEKSQEFLQKFSELCGSVTCRYLIGADLSTPEGFNRAIQENIREKECSKFIEASLKILDDIL